MGASVRDRSAGRVEVFFDMVRQMSMQRDPLALLEAYRQRSHFIVPYDHVLSVSRKGLPAPQFRITRSSRWRESINPWREPQRLPLLEAGWLGEMLYGGKPLRRDALALPDEDPAAPYFEGMQSLLAAPIFDEGQAQYMVFLTRAEPGAYNDDDLATLVLTANLIGRINGQLILTEKLRDAYEALDAELRSVGQMQQALLPARLPLIPGAELAAHYQTSARAGGDYYNLFALPEQRWGMLIADVSGHGTPAAVVTAMLHTMLQGEQVPTADPPALLAHLNQRLSRLVPSGMFVTALYGIYAPRSGTLDYSTAGHDAPRWHRAAGGSPEPLEGSGGLPLAIDEGADPGVRSVRLDAGDRLLFYTDGVTESFAPDGAMFGVDRLDAAFQRGGAAASAGIQSIAAALEAFTGGAPPHDDRTLLALAIGGRDDRGAARS